MAGEKQRRGRANKKLIDRSYELRLAFKICEKTGQPLHSVLSLPTGELNLWGGFFMLEKEEEEYFFKHKKPRPIGWNAQHSWAESAKKEKK